MSTIINSRSPYYIKIEPSSGNLSSAELSLYIYSGTLTTDKPGNATYTISKDKIGSNNYVIFEFTELIRDYIVTEYGSYATDGVWVEADVIITKSIGSPETQNYDYLAFDGYGYFEDGVNPRTSTNPDVTKVTGTATGSGSYKLIDSSAKFTKTFSLPAIKDNNKVFQHYYNYNIDDGFDARVKKNATIELNYLPFQKGKIKLDGVDMVNGKPCL